MARPFWLRLFGPNPPATLDDFRTALENLPIGGGFSDSQFIVKFRAIMDLPAPTDERTARVATARDDVSIRDLPMVAAAILTRPEIGTDAPEPGSDLPQLSPQRPPAEESGADEPSDAAEQNDVRVFAVEVRLPWQLAFGLAPIAPDSASWAKQEPVGWLENYLHAQAQSMSILVPFGADDAANPHWEDWAGPALGTLNLSGDFSSGFALAALPCEIDRITFSAGNDQNLAASDNLVAAGQSLIVDGAGLGDANSMIFDGSEESDGRFIFYGSGAGDNFIGGSGNDLIYGNGGADVLRGGGGSDTFAYNDAAESSGADYDILADFDPGSDKIDLDVTVSGFDAAIAAGTLSTASFDADLAAALAGLGAGRAVVYAPDAGDLAGTIFLVVDGNGIVGYQEGEDYVLALPGTTLASLSGHTDFFI